jgi:hypothetical protein
MIGITSLAITHQNYLPISSVAKDLPSIRAQMMEKCSQIECQNHSAQKKDVRGTTINFLNKNPPKLTLFIPGKCPKRIKS